MVCVWVGSVMCVHVLRVDRNNVVQDTLVQVGELVCVGGSVVCVWVGRVGDGEYGVCGW